MSPQKSSHDEKRLSAWYVPWKLRKKLSAPTDQDEERTAWSESNVIPDKCSLKRYEFMVMLTTFQICVRWITRWDFNRQLQSNLELATEWPKQLLLHRSGPTEQNFRQSEIKNMLEIKVMETARTKCPSPLVQRLKKHRTLTFSVDYKTLSAVNVWNLYPFQRWTKARSLSETLMSFQRSMEFAANRGKEWKKPISQRQLSLLKMVYNNSLECHLVRGLSRRISACPPYHIILSKVAICLCIP